MSDTPCDYTPPTPCPECCGDGPRLLEGWTVSFVPAEMIIPGPADPIPLEWSLSMDEVGVLHGPAGVTMQEARDAFGVLILATGFRAVTVTIPPGWRFEAADPNRVRVVEG